MKKNQSDIVTEELGYRPDEIVERVMIPGLHTLHLKSIDDIAQALAVVLKSRNNLTELRYKVGEFIELTTK